MEYKYSAVSIMREIPQETPIIIEPKKPYPQKAVFKSKLPSINFSQDVSFEFLLSIIYNNKLSIVDN